LFSSIYFNYSSDNLNSSEEVNMHKFGASDRVLIFAPHPDDESLSSSGIIQKALAENAQVKVVVVTTGDAMEPSTFNNTLKSINQTNFNGTIGDLRHNEIINAMNHLGLSQDNIIFLGYPDRGLRDLFENNWDNNNTYKRDKGSNQYNQSPYNFSYQKNAPYSGANVVNNYEKIIRDFNPTVIFYPDDDDEHPDHWATTAFVRYVKTETDYQGKTYEYLVHKGIKWPSPLTYAPSLDLKFPNEVLYSKAAIIQSDLNQIEEDKKKAAVESHTSQIFQTRELLQSFIRKTEPFTSYPSYIKIDEVTDADLLQYTLPSSSFPDPKTDDRAELLEQSEDINSLGMAYDKQNLYLVLHTDGKVNEQLENRFHLRIFNGTNYSRIDIKIKDGTAIYESKASNSIIGDQPPEIDVYEDIMMVSVPLSFINGAQKILVYADVRQENGTEIIDSTGIRTMFL
jgi:LmbE family N-acetylglucosaminyl deacetylase